MHARPRVCASHFQCVCVCVYICLSVCLLRCSCFVPLMSGVQGLHGGLCKISFSCFATKALLQRNRRNSLKWRRARLNYSAFTINFSASPALHLDTSSDHRASRLIMGMLSIPCAMSSLAPAAAGAWICV